MNIIDSISGWLGYAPSPTEPHQIAITVAGQEYDFTAGHVGSGEHQSNLRITWINGIANELDGCQESAETISALFDNQNVHYFHNPTYGLVSDVLWTGWHKLGYDCAEALALAKVFREQIADLGGVHSGGRILHLAHSHGALVTQIAAAALTEEEKAMIDVITFGPARLVSKDDGFRSATNFVSYSDWVSRHDRAVDNHARGYFTSDEVKLLTSLNQTAYVDHIFASPTYQTALDEHRMAYLSSLDPASESSLFGRIMRPFEWLSLTG